MSRLDDEEQAEYLERWRIARDEIEKVRTAHRDGAIGLIMMLQRAREIRRKYGV